MKNKNYMKKVIEALQAKSIEGLESPSGECVPKIGLFWPRPENDLKFCKVLTFNKKN